MRGIHDLGGRAGFGAVDVEPHEPVFHDDWERGVFGICTALLTSGHLTGMRHAIERMDPAHYLTSSYYEHWYTAAATRSIEDGLVAVDQIETRAGGHVPLARPVHLVSVADPGDDRSDPVFAAGDRVTVEDRYFDGHDRCPGYVSGRTGTVVRSVEASHVPEVEVHLGILRKEPSYVVAFEAADLWGPDAEPGVSVLVELYEHHLSNAGEAP